MKKKICLTIFLLIILMANSVFAVSTTMQIVEDNVCTINLTDSSSLEKKLISYDLTKHQVTLQLKVKNDS